MAARPHSLLTVTSQCLGITTSGTRRMPRGWQASATLRRGSLCEQRGADTTKRHESLVSRSVSQTPTLNARPIRRAIKQTCRRGVDVILFLDLGKQQARPHHGENLISGSVSAGFNDKGESIPFQGGTNEQVVEGLYDILRPEGKAKYLKVYWSASCNTLSAMRPLTCIARRYTGKDQIRPLNAIKKQRNAHIKFANFDDQVAILGNGNQDTQVPGLSSLCLCPR